MRRADAQVEVDDLVQYMTDMKFLPGGRYIYYAGRDPDCYYWCYLLRAEDDTREDWQGRTKATSCLALAAASAWTTASIAHLKPPEANRARPTVRCRPWSW